MKKHGGPVTTMYCTLCSYRLKKVKETTETWVDFPRTRPCRPPSGTADSEARPAQGSGETAPDEPEWPAQATCSAPAQSPAERAATCDVDNVVPDNPGSEPGTAEEVRVARRDPGPRQYVYPGRIQVNSQMFSSQHHPLALRALSWLKDPPTNSSMAFAWIAIWRWMQTTQYLDEIVLLKEPNGNQRCTFNRNTPHGSWNMVGGTHLRIECTFQDPGERCKWCILQNVPGTGTWIGVKDEDDLQWTIIMSEYRGGN